MNKPETELDFAVNYPDCEINRDKAKAELADLRSLIDELQTKLRGDKPYCESCGHDLTPDELTGGSCDYCGHDTTPPEETTT